MIELKTQSTDTPKVVFYSFLVFFGVSLKKTSPSDRISERLTERIGLTAYSLPIVQDSPIYYK